MKNKEVSFVLFLFFFLINALTTIAQLKIDETHFKKLFEEQNYVQAYQEAMQIRKSKAYGKNYFIDYIIGKSLCQTGNFPQAQKCFNYLLSAYPLNKELKSKLNDEAQHCNNNSEEQDIDVVLALLNTLISSKNNIPTAVSRGKMGWVLKCNETQTTGENNGGDFELAIKMTPEEFSARLFEMDRKKEAINFYSTLLGNSYRADTSGRFIIITEKAMTIKNAEIAATANKLEKAYGFYTSYYGVRRPDKLITVYLMGSKPALDNVALLTHRLKLPVVNIGYSCLSDLSILGNSDAKSVGTLYHELFHLIIRTDIGDIPAWLDEGIAALYETSFWQNDTLKGQINNWRTEVLSAYLRTTSIKPLKFLIGENWSGFTVNSYKDACETAVNYALAKHFAIFMQEHNWLQPVVTAFRDRKNVFTDTSYVNKSSIEILENSIGLKIDSIQKIFDKWLYITYHLGAVNKDPDILSRLYSTERTLEALKYESIPEGIRLQLKDLTQQCKYLIAAVNKAKQVNTPSNSVDQQNTLSPIPQELENKALAFLEQIAQLARKYSDPKKKMAN